MTVAELSGGRRYPSLQARVAQDEQGVEALESSGAMFGQPSPLSLRLRCSDQAMDVPGAERHRPVGKGPLTAVADGRAVQDTVILDAIGDDGCHMKR